MSGSVGGELLGVLGSGSTVDENHGDGPFRRTGEQGVQTGDGVVGAVVLQTTTVRSRTVTLTVPTSRDSPRVVRAPDSTGWFMSSDTSSSSRPIAPSPAASSCGRIRTLDGLRGLTAVAVVLHHCTEASTPALVDVEHGVERPAVWS